MTSRTFSYDRETIEDVLSAIRINDDEVIESILETYDLSQWLDASKANLLHRSTEYGNEKIIRSLLDHGCNVNAQDSTGTTPLMIALERNHDTKITEMLLKAGANIMMVNFQKKSAIQMTCEKSVLFTTSKLIIQELCKTCSNSEETAQKLMVSGCYLFQAAFLADSKVLEYMLGYGFDVDSMHLKTNQTALHIAVRENDVDSVKLLLKHGANPHTLDKKSCTPLTYLYDRDRRHSREKMEILQILLDLKVSLITLTDRSHFHVTSTLIYGDYKAIRAVLSHENMDFTARDGNNKIVLHYLVINKNPGIANELKRYINQCDINLHCNEGSSPLELAWLYNSFNMIEFLLNEGVNPNSPDPIMGTTPLFRAFKLLKPLFKEEIEQCVEMMLQHNADPQIIVTTKTNKELTIFDVAVKMKTPGNLKPVIAQLGILEKHGVPIKELITTRINSRQPLKRYFSRCKQLLTKNVSENITLLKLLTADENQMARYAGNRKLLKKLTRLNYRQALKDIHAYYYNTVKKRFLKGIKLRRFLDKVAGVICKISKNRFHKENLVTHKIISYLNDESLQKLYQW